MAALADAVGRAGRSSSGAAADDEAAQRLLPSGGGIEMMSFGVDPFGGGAARRRARVMERLESMDPENQGNIDKQKLVDLVDDIVEMETSRKTARSGVLVAAAFAAILLVGISVLTWAVVGRLHAHVDRLSEHVNALSMGGGTHDSASVNVPVGRPSIVLTGVTRSVGPKLPEPGDKSTGGRHRYGVGRGMAPQIAGGGPGTGAAQLFPVEYVYAYSGANVTSDQLAKICTAVNLGELDFTVNFKGGVTEGGRAPGDTSGRPERMPKELKPPMRLRKATVSEASLCDDPGRAAGELVLAIKSADASPYSSNAMLAKITCTAGADQECSFSGETMLDKVDSFQCIDQHNATMVWSCPDLFNIHYRGTSKTEAEVSRMCGAVAGTCFRNVSRAKDPDSMRWTPTSAIEAQIEPTDSCVLFNASNLQCLRCRTTCPSACVNADAPPAEVCKEEPDTPGCDTCSLGATCGRQQCGETCIPAHAKVTVRSQSEDPEGYHRLRACCNSTNGVPWSLQSESGAPQGEKRCYPAR